MHPLPEMLLIFCLNAFFLFVLHKGVAGVATATVISRIINLVIVVLLGAVLVKAKQHPERESNRAVMGQIIRIGLPSACETAIYNVSMTLVIRFLNQMDAQGLNVTARSYTMQITNFSYCVGAALAQANAIMTGWHIGAKEYDACDRGTRKSGDHRCDCCSYSGNNVCALFRMDYAAVFQRSADGVACRQTSGN